MPQAHFECAACALAQLRVYRAADVGTDAWPLRCRTCGGRLVAAPQPGDFAIDAKEPFQRFTVHRQQPTRDGVIQVEETIDSLHKMRKVEHDSEQRYKDGEGEPMRFRMYSNTASNRDVGSFGKDGVIGDRQYDSGKTPKKKPNISTIRHGGKKPDIKVARHAGKSALGRR